MPESRLGQLVRRRLGRAIRTHVERERFRESYPGGLFGTYWRGGFEGRDQARKEAMQRWDRLLARARKLEQ